jgi:hypothetical protein
LEPLHVDREERREHATRRPSGGKAGAGPGLQLAPRTRHAFQPDRTCERPTNVSGTTAPAAPRLEAAAKESSPVLRCRRARLCAGAVARASSGRGEGPGCGAAGGGENEPGRDGVGQLVADREPEGAADAAHPRPRRLPQSFPPCTPCGRKPWTPCCRWPNGPTHETYASETRPSPPSACGPRPVGRSTPTP